MLTALDRKEAKGVVRLAITEAGGQENAVNVSGRIDRPASFSEYANLEREDRQMPIDVAVELDQFNGNARIVEWMARKLGCILVKAPVVTPAHDEIEGLLASAKEFADAIAAGWAARTHCAPAERAAVIAHLDRAVASFEAYRAFLGSEDAS